jgi:hypothetical protein
MGATVSAAAIQITRLDQIGVLEPICLSPPISVIRVIPAKNHHKYYRVQRRNRTLKRGGRTGLLAGNCWTLRRLYRRVPSTKRRGLLFMAGGELHSSWWLIRTGFRRAATDSMSASARVGLVQLRVDSCSGLQLYRPRQRSYPHMRRQIPTLAGMLNLR